MQLYLCPRNPGLKEVAEMTDKKESIHTDTFKWEMTVMIKRFISVILALALICGMLPQTLPRSSAAEDRTAVVYYLEPRYADKVTIPADMPQSYQIPTEGLSSPSFRIIYGDWSAEVSSTGLVTPAKTVYYWKNGVGYSWPIEGYESTTVDYNPGEATISVMDNGREVFRVNVDVRGYAAVYYHEKISEIADGIGVRETELDTFRAVVQYVAENTDYSASTSSGIGMLINGSGDCWASTDFIVDLCHELGIRSARNRYAAHDAGAGGGHRNVVAKLDGDYYIGDAGYTGTKPRFYSVREEPMGFAVSGSRIYQYDGDETDVVVPEKIGDRVITTLGYTDEQGGVFAYAGVPVKSVTIPAGITNILNPTFFAADSLKNIFVDANNPNYTDVGGLLYTKDRTVLLAVPEGRTGTLAVPEGTRRIEKGVFWYCSGLTEIFVPEGVTEIGDFAFVGLNDCAVVLPASVTSIGQNAFSNAYGNRVVRGPAGCYAETWCQENSIPFERCTVDGSGAIQVEHTLKGEPEEREPTCTKPGGIIDFCTTCKQWIAVENEKPALGHAWDSGEITTWPTLWKTGVIRHTCTRCGVIQSESITAKEAGLPFEDVRETAYYRDPVFWAFYTEPQVTAGTSATRFSPGSTCTRRDVVTFLWRAAGCPKPKTAVNPFNDVRTGGYYYEAVLWAVENGVTKGTSATTFGPKNTCTRRDVVTFLWRAAGEPEPASAENRFEDVPEDAYYTKAVLWAVERKITSGVDGTHFAPKDFCTRAEIVTFLYRANQAGGNK